MAKKKAAKKARPKKKISAKRVAPSKKAQNAYLAEQAASGTLGHRLHLHNISAKTASWTISGGGNRARGTTPSGGESSVVASHARRYKVTLWNKPEKKVSVALGPDGTAIYNGRTVAVTHPH